MAAIAGCLSGESGGTPGELTAKESLTDDFTQNHLHGLAYDHVDEQLYLATHHGLFVLKNDADLYLVGDSTDDFMGFTMHPETPEILYRSGHPRGGGNLGVERSEDGGFTWSQIFTGVNNETVDFHMMTISDAAPEVLIGMYHGKLYVTEDAGESWRIAAGSGLPAEGSCWGAPCLATDSDDPMAVFAGTNEGLFLSRDLGETWQQHAPAVILGVTAHPAEASVLYGYSRDGIVRSTDRGETWTKSADGDSVGSDDAVFGFAVNRAAPDILYAGTTQNRVLKSADGGDTWTEIEP